MTEPGTAAGPKPAELLGAKHDDPDPTGPLTDYESVPDTAAHPAACVDDPSMPHVDPATGACACLGPCCSDDKVCICPACCGSCGDDHGN